MKLPHLSISWTIPLLIVTPIITAVGLTNWLAFRSGQKAAHELAEQLSAETSDHIKANVKNYLDTPKIVNRVSEFAIVPGEELKDIAAIGDFFWELQNKSDLIPSIFFANAAGEYVGIEKRDGDTLLWLIDEPNQSNVEIYSLDQQGNRVGNPEIIPFDVKERPWYQAALREETLTWSSIFPSASKNTLLVTSALPIYDKNRSLLGVLEIDIPLAEISKFLRELEIGTSGEAIAFIIEPSGNIVASSAEEPAFKNNERLNAADSSNPLVQATQKALIEEFGGLKNIPVDQEQFMFDFKGGEQLVQVQSAKEKLGLDWLIVIVIPEADFLGSIYTSQRFTFVLAVIITALSTVLGLITSRWIVQPIRCLNQSARDIESENFQPEVLDNIVQRTDEVGELARVFQAMATVIDAREAGLTEQMDELRLEIDQARNTHYQGRNIDVNYLKSLQARAKLLRDQENN
ncbi:MAG: cache domain-containing protein [Spirulinaceae cyanobacterium]